jgi:hypothetical protein
MYIVSKHIHFIRSDTVSDTFDVMWKKFHDTKKDQELPVIIAGYQGSSDAALTAKVTQDVEFGAAIAALGTSSVTYLLWKVQSADAPKEKSAPESRCVDGEGDPSEMPPSSDSDSDVTCARDVARAESPSAGTSTAAQAGEDCESDSLPRNGRKRQRTQSLDDDDFDSS